MKGEKLENQGLLSKQQKQPPLEGKISAQIFVRFQTHSECTVVVGHKNPVNNSVAQNPPLQNVKAKYLG